MKENTDTLRPSDLVLSSYGSPLRKPVIGWLLDDDRDAYANAATARGLDVVVPARAERRAVLLQDRALVLPAVAPAGGLAAGLADLLGLLRAEAGLG